MTDYSETPHTSASPYAVRYQEPAGPPRTWFWVLLAGLCGLFLFGGVVFAAASSALNHVKQSGPIPARYYLAFIDRDYTRAYGYLDRATTVEGHQVSAHSFATLATAADRREGQVLGFVIAPATGDSSRVTLTVHRLFGEYTIHLSLRHNGAAERIVSADGL